MLHVTEHQFVGFVIWILSFTTGVICSWMIGRSTGYKKGWQDAHEFVKGELNNQK